MIRSSLKIIILSLFRILCSLTSMKVISFYIGPAGMLMYGQLQSFMQISSTVISSVTSTGVVKYTASGEYSERNVLATSFYMALVYAIVVFTCFYISSKIFVGSLIDTQWSMIYILIPISSLFFSITNLFLSIFNGRANYNQYVFFSIINASVTLIVTITLAYMFAIKGVMLSLIVAPIMASLMCFPFLRILKLPKFTCKSEINFQLAKLMTHYSFMALTSVVLVYGVQIYLRYLISIFISPEDAGIWFSVTKLSEVYMGVVSIVFSTLILPKYAKSDSVNDIGKEVNFCLKVLTPLILIMIFSIYIFSPAVIDLVYGDAFISASNILRVYALGDAFKIITWVYLYVALTRKNTAVYIKYEIISAALYLLLCTFFLINNGSPLYMAIGYVVQGGVSTVIIALWYYIKGVKCRLSI